MCFKINFPEKPKILLIEFLKARHIHWSLHCFSQTHTQIIFYFYLLPFFLVVVNLLSSVRASLVPQLVKNLPEMHLTRVRYLGWEDPLEQGMASHSSILAGEFLGLYGPWNPRESHLIEGLSHHFTSLYITKVIYSSFWVISVPPIPFIIDVYATFQLQRRCF